MKNIKFLKRIAAVLLITILAFSVVGCGDDEITSQENEKEKAKEMYYDLHNAIKEKGDLVQNYLANDDAINDTSVFEHETVEALLDAYRNVIQADNATELAKASAEQDEAIDAWIDDMLASYPEVCAGEGFNTLLDELSDADSRINDAIEDYNEAAEEYNEHASEGMEYYEED